jgi:hypothetical protein
MPGKRKFEAKRWFQQAYFDLKAIRWNIQGGFFDTGCFLAQQAAEKALKSLLYFQGARRTALLTHSLVEMVPGTRSPLYPFPLSKRDSQRLSPPVLRKVLVAIKKVPDLALVVSS